MSSIPALSKLREYEKMGLIRSQTHPELPLNIFVYTQTTGFERLWNNVTMACRGLVVDDKDRCIVRCLPKFFNHDEPHIKPDYKTRVEQKLEHFDKMDGSLIQVVNDREYGLVVTSKGSFTSDQAVWAKDIIKELGYSFDVGITYVFELIHPDNRIVLDYQDRRELVLLAVVNTEAGTERDIYTNRFDQFNKVPRMSAEEVIEHLKRSDVEGIVVNNGGYRYKIKTEEYVRLHRIVTEFTPKRVWEALKDGDSLEFKNMPEEFQAWLDLVIQELQGAFDAIDTACYKEFVETKELSDKEVGLSKYLEYKGLVFMQRNKRDKEQIKQAIWKMIKPKKEVV